MNVHIFPADFVAQSRVFKITRALAQSGYFTHVDMIGIQKDDLPAAQSMDAQRTIYRLHRPMPEKTRGTVAKAWGTVVWSWNVWSFLRGKPVTCINCHSLPVLPLCVALKWRHKSILVYDTHELETETSVVRGIRKPLAKAVERLLIRYANFTFCVSERIAQWYRDQYRIPLPVVIRNIPDTSVSQSEPNTQLLRQRAGIPNDALVFLYLGALSYHRGIERVLKLFAQLPGTHHLVFMGDGPLKPMVQQHAEQYANMHYLPPVKFNEVVHIAAGADVGISVIDAICLSHYYALSNKFFEYIQAGLPVLVGDLLEQRTIVDTHGIGWNMPEDDATAVSLIKSITTADVAARKANVVTTRPLYRWQNEQETLLTAYAAIMAKSLEN